jgi:hypothetical protein
LERLQERVAISHISVHVAGWSKSACN